MPHLSRRCRIAYCIAYRTDLRVLLDAMTDVLPAPEAFDPNDVVRRLDDRIANLAGGDGRLRLRSDVDVESLPPLEWLAQGILPLGCLAALYGAPGSGKSFLALDLALSLAGSQPWLERATTQGGTLYVAGEGLAGLSQRVVAWKRARNWLGQHMGIGFVTEGIDLLKPADVARVIVAAKNDDIIRQPLRLIVLDTLARSMIGDENDTKDMSRVIAAADKVRAATDAAVLLVHHTRKDSDQERGSTALRGAVDTLMLCEEGDEGRQLVCQKQKDAEAFSPIPFRLVGGFGSCIVQASGSSEDASEQARVMTPKRLQALRALRDAFTGRGATTTEWFKASNLSERTFYRVRTWLVSEGYAHESNRGARYQITGSGTAALAGLLPTATVLPRPTAIHNGHPLKGVTGWQPQHMADRENGSGMTPPATATGGTGETGPPPADDRFWSSLLNDADSEPA